MYDKNPYRLLNSALDSKKKKKGESKKDERIKGVRDALCPCDDRPCASSLLWKGVCDAVLRGQEGGGPEAVQGGGAGLLCGLRSRPHRLT